MLVVAAILGVSLAALVVWMAGSAIAAALGRTGMNIVTRIMGLLLAAIAVESIIAGLAGKFTGWLRAG